MIRVIDRYFLKEFIPPFFFSSFALTFILLMDQLFRLIDLFVRKGLPFDIVGQILIYTVPLIFSYTAPMAILVAVVMTFGRFARDNEILALKTSGLTFFSIMRTPFIITTVFMILLILFNSYILPEANHRVRNLMLDVSRKRPAIRLPEGVFTNDFPGYTIYIGKKDERHSKLYDITIYDLKNGLMITAPNGELKDFEEEGILQFTLYDGELHQLIDNQKYQRTKFDKQTINMEIDTDLVRKERKYRNQNELNIGGLLAKIEQTKKEIEKLKMEIAEMGSTAISSFVNEDIPTFNTTSFKIKKKSNVVKGKTKKISRYLVELNKKFSLAVACILFVIIGAPIGYLFRKGGIGGILIGVLLFSLYYILVLAGEEFADRRGFSPFWAMWLPNIILLGSGIYLFMVAEFEKLPIKRFFK
ncbi:MAG TPA: YjgP/YjgQ family permease [candidate division WOR-3 bacterium]|uniref:YjgP/YjgQ family permease n=1 Tax=candidate division WOR-3 bacterium TaxID=2052148 RepID=A0A9C9JZZ9_UNCW3|nr:YjgP/YjgQ family permease [candidate division WOR-3 bacterium]